MQSILFLIIIFFSYSTISAQSIWVKFSDQTPKTIQKKLSTRSIFQEPWMAFQSVTSNFSLMTHHELELLTSNEKQWIDATFLPSEYELDAISYNDSLFSTQWNLKAVNYSEIPFSAYNFQQVIVAIIDTGIDPEHEDLKNQLWINSEESNSTIYQPTDINFQDEDGDGIYDDIIGINVISNSTNLQPLDDQGHGTAVSGIIAAQRNNLKGITGIAPNVKILSIKAFDKTGNGTDLDVAKALLYAWYRKADVVNMSFGSKNNKSLLVEAICEAMEKDGIILVASSGNSGGFDRHYPSGYESVISVGASTENNSRAIFSMFGNRLDILAPGVRIPTTKVGNEYQTFNGTSASAPHISALAALAKGLRPEITATNFKKIVQHTATRAFNKTFSATESAGIVDFQKSLEFISLQTVVKIESPIHDGWWFGDTLSIVTTVISPNFKQASIYFQSGLAYPEKWIKLADIDEQHKQRKVFTLNQLSFDPLLVNDSVFSIRLSVTNLNGSIMEDRKTLFRKKESLTIKRWYTDWAFSSDGPVIWGNVETNYPSTFELNAEQNSQYFSSHSMEWKYQSYVTLHANYQTQDSILVSLIVTDLTGEIKILQKKLSPPPQFNPTNILSKKEIKILKSGPSISTLTDFNSDGIEDFIFSSPLPGSTYGYNYFYDGTNFEKPVDSLTMILVPKDAIYFQGKWYYMGIISGNTFIFETNPGTNFPSKLLHRSQVNQQVWGAQFIILDNELGYTWRNSNGYFISTVNLVTGAETLKHQLIYPVQGALSGVSKTIYGNFFHQDSLDIVYSDPSGNVLFYRYQPSLSNLQLRHVTYLPLYESNSYIAKGDLNGDGVDDLIAASHDLQFEHPRYLESFPNRWNISGYSYNNHSESNLFSKWVTGFVGESGRSNGLWVETHHAVPTIIFSSEPHLYTFHYANNQLIPLQILNQQSTSYLIKKNQTYYTQSNNGINELSVIESPIPIISNFSQVTDTSGYFTFHALTNDSLFIWKKVGTTYQLIERYAPTDTPSITITQSEINTPLSYITTFTTELELGGGNENYRDITFYQQGNISAQYEHEFLTLSATQPIQFGSMEINLLHFKNHPITIYTMDISKREIKFKLPIISTGYFKLPMLKDVNQRLLNNVQDSIFIPNLTTLNGLFYIAKSKLIHSKQMEIYFSQNIQPSSLSQMEIKDQANQLIEYTANMLSPSSLSIKLNNIALGSVGKEFILTISKLKSILGIDLDAIGNQIMMTQPSDNINTVVVYPSPWNMSTSAFLYFGNLPKSATIQIYDINGRKLSELKKDSFSGVFEFNGKIDSGELSSGIYIYRILSSNGEEVIGKIGIVR